MSNWFEKHVAVLDKALDACARRYSWTAYPESPSSRIHGAELPARGRQHFDALLGSRFELPMAGQRGWVGAEVSPFTRESLGISYPLPDIDAVFAAARAALPGWRDAGVRERADAARDQARAILAPLGARPALARADPLAQRLAILSPAPAPEPGTTAHRYPAGLTAREVEVLRVAPRFVDCDAPPCGFSHPVHPPPAHRPSS